MLVAFRYITDNDRGGEVLWTPESARVKISIVGALTMLTLAFHYHAWTVTPAFGHQHWLHAIHGRLCYIPIVVAASWFGLRGGLYTATVISILVLPYAIGYVHDPHDFVSEMAEIVFYFAIAILIGVLVEREFTARRKQQDAQLQMERSQKLSVVGQLAAGVAHEIKNPLASIKGAADILTDDDTSRNDREEFKEILRNEIRRIDATVAEFLEFARPKETRFETLDLSKALGATLRQIEAHAKREGLSIETDIQGNIIVKGDGEKLHQLVLNLLLNAIQASEPGHVIRVSLGDRGAEGIRLMIVDSGAGIKQSDMEHIFDPFFTTRSSGTGLGLAVVKDIVESHSGDITIDSEVGRGTTVTITLPRGKEGAINENTAGRR
jgi:two-component system sensor histidine kinase HydH